jgi:hypothetical protein
LTPDRVQLDVAVRGAAVRQTPLELARAELDKRQREVKEKPKDLGARYWRGVAFSRLGDDRQAQRPLGVSI